MYSPPLCVFCIPDGSGGGGPQTRAALEPILEEESDDEAGCDGDFWSNGSGSSGSSDTGSVVQLAEANFITGVPYSPPEETDSVSSERDFLCPPKRRRQELSHHSVFNTALLAKSDQSADSSGGGGPLAPTLISSSVKFSPHKIRFDALVDEPDYHKKR